MLNHNKLYTNNERYLNTRALFKEMIRDKQLLELIEEIDPYVTTSVKLIAVGGTAMTLQGLKDSTIDVDFNIPNQAEYEHFKKTLEKIGFKNIRPGGMNLKVISPNGIILDIFSENYIFCVKLVEPINSVEIRKFKKIEVRAINPYDLIITKTARSDTRDYDDITSLATNITLDYDYLFKRYRDCMTDSMVNQAPQLILDILEYLKNKKKINIPDKVIEDAKKWKDESQTH